MDKRTGLEFWVEKTATQRPPRALSAAPPSLLHLHQLLLSFPPTFETMGAGASFTGYENADAVLAKATENLAAYPENRCCKYLLNLKESGKLAEMSPEDLSKLFLCAKTGLDNVESGLGCYAMGPKDYEDFGFFFGKDPAQPQ
jgi:hypothetical protein